MNWRKVIGLVGVTCIALSSLAQVIAGIVPDYRNVEKYQEIIRWMSYLWAYASVIMGKYLMDKTYCVMELVWGIVAAFACLIPVFGMLGGMIYFFLVFAKLDKMKNGLPF